jgi:hypothetical protein
MKRADSERKREDLVYAKRRILRELAKEGLLTEEQAKEQSCAPRNSGRMRR